MFKIKKSNYLLLILMAVVVGGFFTIVNPSDSHLTPRCKFKMTTGWDCPGCGSTRAFYHLAHGQPFTALTMNPLLVVSMPFIIWTLFKPGWLKKLWAVSLIAGIVILYGIARNIPSMPFKLLKPGGWQEHQMLHSRVDHPPKNP